MAAGTSACAQSPSGCPASSEKRKQGGEERQQKRQQKQEQQYQDVDDQFPFPFLLPATRAPRRDSIKAQQVLGLITVTGLRRSNRASVNDIAPFHSPLSRTRSRSEERPPRTERWSLYTTSDEVSVSEVSVEVRYRNPKRDSVKAQQMLGLVTDHRGMWRRSQRASILRERTRSEERIPSSLGSVYSTDEAGAREQSALLPADSGAEAETEGKSTVERPSHAINDAEFERLLDEITTPRSIFSTQPAPRDFALSSLTGPPRSRASTFVNFSRPLSQQQSPNPVLVGFPGRLQIPPHPQKVTRDDIGVPRTPSFANTLTQAKPIFERVPVEDEKTVKAKQPYQRHHRRSRLWTSLPPCLMRLGCKIRTTEPNIHQAANHSRSKSKDKEEKVPLTEDNLREYEIHVGHVPKPLNKSLLPTPLQSPISPSNNVNPPFPTLHHPTISNKPLPTPPASEPSTSMSSGPFSDTEIETPTIRNPPVTPTFLRTPSVTPTLHHANANAFAVITNYQIDLSICEVCREARPADAFPIRQCTSRCTHPPHVCTDCVQQWVSSCVQDRGWNACVCPECGVGLDYADVKFFATEEVFLRYDDLATRSALSAIPSFYWCLAPECDSGQIHPWALEAQPTFVCTACGHVTCLNHPEQPFHGGLSCVEFDGLLAGKAEERRAVAVQELEMEKTEKGVSDDAGGTVHHVAGCTASSPAPSPSPSALPLPLSPPSSSSSRPRPASTALSLPLSVSSIHTQQQRHSQIQSDAQLARTLSKRCPNALCGWWIEKSEGCDHMTCVKCGFEWCWECGAPFGVIRRKGGKFHRAGCRYWG